MTGVLEVNAETTPAGRHGPAAIFGKLLIFFMLAISLWSIATPLMAYPDEPAHTIKAAAVVRGQVTVQEGTSFGHGVHVRVPAYIANLVSQSCVAFKRDVTADCAPPIPSGDTYEAIGVTSAGSYNPLYYWIVGLPTLFMSGAPAIFAMRIVSALLSAVFYAAAFTALLQLRRPKWPLITASIALTPMALFLASGINPNSLEIAATVAAFCSLLPILEGSRSLGRVKPAIVTVGIATAVLANTRSVSLVWLLCAILAACVLFRWRDFAALFKNRLVLIAIAVGTLGVVAGLGWMVLSMRGPSASGAAPELIANATNNVAPYQAFVTMIDRTWDYLIQYIGVMGWLDTSLPQIVIAFWTMLILVAILMPLTVRPRRQVWGYVAILLSVSIVPAIIQALLIRSAGFIWQGRYTMPLFMVLLISAGMLWRGHALRPTSRNQTLGRLLIISTVIAHVIAFAYVLRRYVAGLTDISTWQTMISNPSWQPPLGWITLAALYTIVIIWAARALYTFLFPGTSLVPFGLTKRRQKSARLNK